MPFTAKVLKPGYAIRAAAVIAAGLIGGSAMASTVGSSSSASNAGAAQQQAPAASQSPAAEISTARSVNDMLADLRSNTRTLASIIGDKSNLREADKRARLSPELIPLEYRQIGLVDELLQQPESSAGQFIPLKQRALAMLYLLNDAPTVKSIDSMKAGRNNAAAVTASSIQIFSRWLIARDAGATSSAAAELVQLDQANPTDSRLTLLSYSLSREADQKTTASLLANAAAAMTNPAARTIAVQVTAANRLALLEGKPLVISGKTASGEDFTSLNWKGKVILVNFCAAWSAPSRSDVAGLKKLYSDNHTRGLEIVNVSNDFSDRAVTDFITRNQIPWPALYDNTTGLAHRLNPIASSLGVSEIPKMFLIDRKGICRSVDARSNIMDLLSTLLAE